MYGRAFAMILMTAVLCLGGMTNAPAAPTSNAAVTSAPVRESAVTVRETVAETIAHHRGLKVIQENLDVTRYELRRAKAGMGAERGRDRALRRQPPERRYHALLRFG